MNTDKVTAEKLARFIKRGLKRRDRNMAETAAWAWSNRIEQGPFRSCAPKKKQRQAGLMPPVTP